MPRLVKLVRDVIRFNDRESSAQALIHETIGISIFKVM
jgi:hypothetical protein